MTDVDAVADVDPVVGLQAPDELAVPDVGGDHLSRSMTQQDIGEPAGRRARVQTPAAVDDEPGRTEFPECAEEFVRAARRPVVAVVDGHDDRGVPSDVRGGLGGGDTVDGDDAVGDEGLRLFAGPGQSATDQLGVQPGARRHQRPTAALRPDRDGRARR